MEAIKPGSTHDQWANPFQRAEIQNRTDAGAEGHPPLRKPHAHSFSIAEDTDHPTAFTKAHRSMTVAVPPPTDNVWNTEKVSSHKESTVEITVRQPTPPPRSEISLRCEPYDPYVSADEVLPPFENRDSMWRNSKTIDHPPVDLDGHEDEPQKEPIYLTILPPEEPSVSAPQSPTHHHRHYDTMVDTKTTIEIVAELEKQFTPLEIDLLVKMLEKVSAKTKAMAESKERRKSADDSVIKQKQETGRIIKPPFVDSEEEIESGGLYSRLADLVLNLDEVESASVLSEQNILCTPESNEISDTAITETECPSKESNAPSSSSSCSSSESSIAAPIYSPRVPSRSNPQHGSLKEGNFSRKNAVRQRKATCAKPKDTVTHLSEFNFYYFSDQIYYMQIKHWSR